MGSNEEDSGDRDRDRDVRMTSSRGNAVLDAEVQSLERRTTSHDRRLRDLEQWQAALNGVAGTPGVIGHIGKELVEVKSDVESHGTRITGVEHIGFKIVAMASIASLVGGAIATVVMHLLGK